MTANVRRYCAQTRDPAGRRSSARCPAATALRCCMSCARCRSSRALRPLQPPPARARPTRRALRRDLCETLGVRGPGSGDVAPAAQRRARLEARRGRCACVLGRTAANRAATHRHALTPHNAEPAAAPVHGRATGCAASRRCAAHRPPLLNVPRSEILDFSRPRLPLLEDPATRRLLRANVPPPGDSRARDLIRGGANSPPRGDPARDEHPRAPGGGFLRNIARHTLPAARSPRCRTVAMRALRSSAGRGAGIWSRPALAGGDDPTRGGHPGCASSKSATSCAWPRGEAPYRCRPGLRRRE
jgi:hypothetical protein